MQQAIPFCRFVMPLFGSILKELKHDFDYIWRWDLEIKAHRRSFDVGKPTVRAGAGFIYRHLPRAGDAIGQKTQSFFLLDLYSGVFGGGHESTLLISMTLA